MGSSLVPNFRLSESLQCDWVDSSAPEVAAVQTEGPSVSLHLRKMPGVKHMLFNTAQSTSPRSQWETLSSSTGEGSEQQYPRLLTHLYPTPEYTSTHLHIYTIKRKKRMKAAGSHGTEEASHPGRTLWPQHTELCLSRDRPEAL